MIIPVVRRRRSSPSRCWAPSAPGRWRQHLARRARVVFWGAFAMALTAGIGALVGTQI